MAEQADAAASKAVGHCARKGSTPFLPIFLMGSYGAMFPSGCISIENLYKLLFVRSGVNNFDSSCQVAFNIIYI